MLRLKYPRGIEWQVNGPETHKLYDASSYTIHLNLHQRVRRKMGAGRDLGECCGSVEKRFGLGGRANGCSDHPLGASSYSIVLGRKWLFVTSEPPGGPARS